MASAYNLRIRRGLMQSIVDTIEARGLKQREAARLFRTTQPRISEISRGKVDEFTIDSLVNMLAAAGLASPTELEGIQLDRLDESPDPVIEAFKSDVDRTLVREALRRSPTERIKALAGLQALAAEARRAGARRSARR